MLNQHLTPWTSTFNRFILSDTLLLVRVSSYAIVRLVSWTTGAQSIFLIHVEFGYRYLINVDWLSHSCAYLHIVMLLSSKCGRKPVKPDYTFSVTLHLQLLMLDLLHSDSRLFPLTTVACKHFIRIHLAIERNWFSQTAWAYLNECNICPCLVDSLTNQILVFKG